MNGTENVKFVFPTGIRRLLVTKQGTVAFPSANNYQGQLLTPRSISAQVTNIMQQTRSLNSDPFSATREIPFIL
jgi:hypothetical protein